jgi:hypothetical protein
MTPQDAINNATYFTSRENWGNLNKVSPTLISTVDSWRGHHGSPILISPVKGAVYADGTGHSGTSWHYTIPGRNDYAMAMDCFPTGDLLRAWFLAICMSNFNGIGIYPYWTYDHPRIGLIQGGLHVDVRNDRDCAYLWWCDEDENYHPITHNNIDDVIKLTRSVCRR